MNIEFPIYICAKDSGEVCRFESIYELQRELEEIDVENAEYWAWDKSGQTLRLAVQRPVWVNVSLSATGNDQSLKESLKKYSETIGAKVEVNGSTAETFSAVYHQLASHLQSQNKIGSFVRRMFSKRQDK